MHVPVKSLACICRIRILKYTYCIDGNAVVFHLLRSSDSSVSYSATKSIAMVRLSVRKEDNDFFCRFACSVYSSTIITIP